ncbi:hypothetical protein FRC98_02760 [Lujinxingia vulgaris]|uniref:Lipoprotein n=1 Tax=Lujinxingia vulgaris TaxID=2600176 RepID=A0A5C6XBP3_9DELT|nr:hypothetical protein [Lujinxingia vulgaris]TXD39337.1 hypothetical protein FRC98_02760 [Lujinxingia vulgaris]
MTSRIFSGRLPFALIGVAALAIVSSAGCAFTDGEPWGWVDVSVQNAGLTDSPSPHIEAITLEVTSIRLLSEGGATTSSDSSEELDPANPPPGFSLCHGGHCHADDGRLVPYDEVLQESAGGPQVVSARPLDATLDTDDSAQERLKVTRRGAVTQVEVELGALELQGALTHEGQTRAYRANVPVRGLRLSSPIDLQFDASSPFEQWLDLRIGLNEDIVEGLDLSETEVEEDGTVRITNTRNRAIAEQLLERVAQHLALTPSPS